MEGRLRRITASIGATVGVVAVVQLLRRRKTDRSNVEADKIADQVVAGETSIRREGAQGAENDREVPELAVAAKKAKSETKNHLSPLPLKSNTGARGNCSNGHAPAWAHDRRRTSVFLPEETRLFYEAALKCLPLDDFHHGALHLAHFQRMAEKLQMHDLQSKELERIMDTMHQDDEGGVSLRSFNQAVVSGPSSIILSNMINKFCQLNASDFNTPASYDFTKSTSENYKLESTTEFTQIYAKFRAKIDYSYHNNYTLARQAWQDHAISSIIVRTTPQAKPWLVYTCGPMGVGKGYALAWMSRHDFFPLENIVHVDPDAFKMMMPEWSDYVERDPENAGTKCHMESCLMMELAQAAAMEKCQNIWIDGSLRNATFYAEQFQEIRQSFPHYQISIFYVYADESTIRTRILKRAERTGRNVPEHLIQASLQAMDHSLNILTPLCNFVARIDNAGVHPILKAFEKVDTTGVWEVVRRQFAMSEAVTEFPNCMEQMALKALSSRRCNAYRVKREASEHVLVISLKGGSKGSIERRLSAVLGDEVTLAMSLGHSVSASSKSSAAKQASEVFWVYPRPSYEGGRLDKARLDAFGFDAEEQTDALFNLLRKGGFCFAKENDAVVALHVHNSNPAPGDLSTSTFGCDSPKSRLAPNCAIQFGKPFPVAPAVLAALPERRLHEVGSVLLRSRGADKYVWCPPGEMVGGAALGGRHGAFVYTMRNSQEAAIAFPAITPCI
eukprot:TRINITY_DN26589_c0_g1_i1.p1 TRINITY_DN26589_c0_g1~~TRINITY_DN26589_c0_g1_i1.p1  ORF type:complete len:740 (+),score=96.35 TRINITY_DN26589_c0_g1_i1:33-2222(+)